MVFRDLEYVCLIPYVRCALCTVTLISMLLCHNLWVSCLLFVNKHFSSKYKQTNCGGFCKKIPGAASFIPMYSLSFEIQYANTLNSKDKFSVVYFHFHHFYCRLNGLSVCPFCGVWRDPKGITAWLGSGIKAGKQLELFGRSLWFGEFSNLMTMKLLKT